jgi:TolB-like protein/Flp pilus assembly protein TadD
VQRFLGELRRRRVLNTAWFYVIGGWLLLQVAEVLQDMLPPGMMRWLLIGLAAGYPLALIVGWFFDISAEGVRRTPPLPADADVPESRFIDKVHVIGQLAIAAFVAYLLVLPQPADDVAGTPPEQRRTIAVLDFQDLNVAADDTGVGRAVAEELRQGLTRTAGLTVMGPRTSAILAAAGDERKELADDMEISSLLVGSIKNRESHLTIDARVIAIPDGQPLWQASFAGPISDGIRLQQDLMRSVIGAVAPSLDPDPVNGPRAQVGQCAEVYEMFLQGKQLILTPATDPDIRPKRERGREMLQKVIETDPDCALAWEALAVNTIRYSMPKFAQAGAMARRALDLNDKLPEAWYVLAEIAEQERRWSDSEEYFLKAIYADPTNQLANLYYAEALMARGRVKEGLRYALDAYRREPGSHVANWRMILNGMYAADWDAVLKHIQLYYEIRPAEGEWLWWEQGYALLMKGEREQALQSFADNIAPGESGFPAWYLDCVRARDDASLREALRKGLVEQMTETREQLRALLGDAPAAALSQNEKLMWMGWAVFTCDVWIGNGDLAIDLMLSQEVTELQFIAFFLPEATVLRQHPRFRKHVRDSGLLDYWREWGWSDYCEPVGEDDFRCD